MADKPKRASEYTSEQVELVKATCLYVAKMLGDMMGDLVVVGGLVSSLIIDQEMLPTDVAPHVGTMDLDVGLQIALLHEGATTSSPSACGMPASRWTRTTQGARLGSAWPSRVAAR
ncbi:MAG: hypothetical protein ACO3JL_01395 [Myxococcota bacterium]